PYENSIAASGVVEARSENIAIGTALGGLVLEVYVPSEKVGTHVVAGQPLFRVDDRHLRAQLKLAQAQLARANARLAKLEQQPRSLARGKVASANVALTKDHYERAEQLIPRQSLSKEEYVIRKQGYESAIHNQARAQAEYDLLKAGAWKPDIDVAKAVVAE